MVIGGYDKGMVESSPFGGRRQRSRPQRATAQRIADLKAGKTDLVSGVKSNTGKVITSKDTPFYDPSLERRLPRRGDRRTV